MRRRRKDHYLVFARSEGAVMEVWRQTKADAMEIFERVIHGGSMEEFTFSGSVRTFRPAFIAVTRELSNFDTVLGRSR